MYLVSRQYTTIYLMCYLYTGTYYYMDSLSLHIDINISIVFIAIVKVFIDSFLDQCKGWICVCWFYVETLY